MSNPTSPWGSPDFAAPNAYGQPPAGQAPYGEVSVQPSAGTSSPYPTSPYTSASYPQPGYHLGTPSPPQVRADYAPWGKRVIAMLIDQFPAYIAMIIFYVGYVLFLLEAASSRGSDLPTTGVVPMIIGFVMSLAALGWTIYNRWLVAGRTGQSWGKRVTKITLISEQTGQPIGPLNAFLRDLMHILDGLAYVGYLWPLWDDKKQTFADMLMKTIVVHAPANRSL